ncbi:hypothetical protein PAHAL_4G351100 [Panicum hallii]|uniref:Uncharacterized protein n=1 Tax=Panicum hallii TaxID=206008 RepID=A0A2S3HMD6_9POAL|nr:hypothetical protein PAHAL_4G351100 [Panicum hallii]
MASIALVGRRGERLSDGTEEAGAVGHGSVFQIEPLCFGSGQGEVSGEARLWPFHARLDQWHVLGVFVHNGGHDIIGVRH